MKLNLQKLYVLLCRNAYTLFVVDNMELARLPESGRLDMKKLGEMWKTLTEPQREVSPILTAHS